MLELDPTNKIQHMQALVSPFYPVPSRAAENQETVIPSSLALDSFYPQSLETLSKGDQADKHMNHPQQNDQMETNKL